MIFDLLIIIAWVLFISTTILAFTLWIRNFMCTTISHLSKFEVREWDTQTQYLFHMLEGMNSDSLTPECQHLPQYFLFNQDFQIIKQCHILCCHYQWALYKTLSTPFYLWWGQVYVMIAWLLESYGSDWCLYYFRLTLALSDFLLLILLLTLPKWSPLLSLPTCFSLFPPGS